MGFTTPTPLIHPTYLSVIYKEFSKNWQLCLRLVYLLNWKWEHHICRFIESLYLVSLTPLCANTCHVISTWIYVSRQLQTVQSTGFQWLLPELRSLGLQFIPDSYTRLVKVNPTKKNSHVLSCKRRGDSIRYRRQNNTSISCHATTIVYLALSCSQALVYQPPQPRTRIISNHILL